MFFVVVTIKVNRYYLLFKILNECLSILKETKKLKIHTHSCVESF
jgi:hypothetical protein